MKRFLLSLAILAAFPSDTPAADARQAAINEAATASEKRRLEALADRYTAARLDGSKIESVVLSDSQAATVRKAVLIVARTLRDPSSGTVRAAVVSESGQFCAMLVGNNAYGARVTSLVAVNVDTGAVEEVDGVNCAAARTDATQATNALFERLK